MSAAEELCKRALKEMGTKWHSVGTEVMMRMEKARKMMRA